MMKWFRRSEKPVPSRKRTGPSVSEIIRMTVKFRCGRYARCPTAEDVHLIVSACEEAWRPADTTDQNLTRLEAILCECEEFLCLTGTRVYECAA